LAASLLWWTAAAAIRDYQPKLYQKDARDRYRCGHYQ
jgi:hypothetical protein